ncbi:MAG: FtsW/RodA/SpoVE family cell cycle protein [Eubacteriales bacterium]|nr:FtsW/RodA/SpoVE family cell cycle protein [Eubacteriales bacterium]
MNAYAISLSKYVNTGLMLLFTLLSFLGFAARGPRLRRFVEIFQQVLLAAFLANANMTIAWIVKGESGRRILLLCAMEILFLLSFMALYRIVHEMADMFLFNNICMLLSIGFVIITRISYYGGSESISYKFNEPIKQFVMASAGLLLMLVIPFFRRMFDGLRHMGIVFGILGIVALSGVLLLSVATNGAMITYTIAGFTFQPSEFVKILYIIMLAALLSGEITRRRAMLVTILCIVHVGILVLSRDLGSALIFFVVYLMMLFLASGRWTVLVTGALLGAAGALVCYFLFYHVRVRVEIWRDPFSVIDSLGYQIAQSLFAISYGGLWGAGLTQGAPDRIPFVESDFIFAAISEELGLIFSVCLILLCINCFLRILSLSSSYSNRFFQLFTYGAAVCYIFQAFLTIGGETKFIPLTGVTLPLVSYGGSSVLSTLIMLGIVEMIYILHDERTARFLERYEMERRAMETTGYEEPYEEPVPEETAPPEDGFRPESFFHNEDMPADEPDNFPVNGISEEGIFDDT